MQHLAHLPDRGVITVAGDDRVAFLQGLVSNDIAAAAPGHAVWAALLSPQGKWLADFFVFADGDTLKLDCEREQIPMLIQRLSRYRLRMKVALAEDPLRKVYVAWNSRVEPPANGSPAGPAAADLGAADLGAADLGTADLAAAGGRLDGLAPAGWGVSDMDIVAPDPRLPDFAWRILSDARPPTNAGAEDWDRHRLHAGLPEGSRDMESDRTVLLEAGFDELGGVSWTKGCYMGQELTARTKYRGLLKRRLVPVSIEGPVPPPGTPVLRDGKDVGTMRSALDQIGLAIIRLDSLGRPLYCADARLTPRIPVWMHLPPREGLG